jgi:hypothetical protein
VGGGEEEEREEEEGMKGGSLVTLLLSRPMRFRSESMSSVRSRRCGSTTSDTPSPPHPMRDITARLHFLSEAIANNAKGPVDILCDICAGGGGNSVELNWGTPFVWCEKN